MAEQQYHELLIKTVKVLKVLLETNNIEIIKCGISSLSDEIEDSINPLEDPFLIPE